MLRRLLLLCAVIYGINTASVNHRHKRSSYPLSLQQGSRRSNDPPVLLQLSPEFFDYPGLQDIYAALQGGGGGRKPRDVYLQLMPSKREVKPSDESAFALKINPEVPRNPMSVRNFNTTQCAEQKIAWCIEAPTTTPFYCPPVDTPTPVPTTCGPVKPVNMQSNCLSAQSSPPLVPKDPCDECPRTEGTTTRYTPCKSVPPPTAVLRLKNCNPTTIPCHSVPCTYRRLEGPSTELPPPTPPSCDAGGKTAGLVPPGGLAALQEPHKYYILVKRSPEGWKRRKRSSQRRFRMVPVDGR